MYVTAGGKGIHRPLVTNKAKRKTNKQIKTNSKQNEFNNKKGKKGNGKVRPFSYTSFKDYGESNKKKRKRN